MLHMSAQCYEHRFGYCTNAKTCFSVHIGAILAERRVLLGTAHWIQSLFIYLLYGTASLNTLYAVWTLAIIDAYAYFLPVFAHVAARFVFLLSTHSRCVLHVDRLHGSTMRCPHLRVLPNLVAASLSYISICYERTNQSAFHCFDTTATRSSTTDLSQKLRTFLTVIRTA